MNKFQVVSKTGGVLASSEAHISKKARESPEGPGEMPVPTQGFTVRPELLYLFLVNSQLSWDGADPQTTI